MAEREASVVRAVPRCRRHRCGVGADGSNAESPGCQCDAAGRSGQPATSPGCCLWIMPSATSPIDSRLVEQFRFVDVRAIRVHRPRIRRALPVNHWKVNPSAVSRLSNRRDRFHGKLLAKVLDVVRDGASDTEHKRSPRIAIGSLKSAKFLFLDSFVPARSEQRTAR